MNTDKTSLEKESQPSCLGAVSGWLHLTDEQTKILADLGSQFLYEGVNGNLRITEFGILEIFHKYNELVGNHR